MPAILLSLLANPAVMSSLVAGIGGLAWYLVSKRTAKAQSNFTLAASLASQVIHQIAAATPTKIDDQLDVFLAEIARSLSAQGQPMKSADVAKAKDLFMAMHGAAPK